MMRIMSKAIAALSTSGLFGVRAKGMTMHRVGFPNYRMIATDFVDTESKFAVRFCALIMRSSFTVALLWLLLLYVGIIVLFGALYFVNKGNVVTVDSTDAPVLTDCVYLSMQMITGVDFGRKATSTYLEM